MKDENTVKSEVTLKQPYGNSAGTYRRVPVCLQFPLGFVAESRRAGAKIINGVDLQGIMQLTCWPLKIQRRILRFHTGKWYFRLKMQ